MFSKERDGRMGRICTFSRSHTHELLRQTSWPQAITHTKTICSRRYFGKIVIVVLKWKHRVITARRENVAADVLTSDYQARPATHLNNFISLHPAAVYKKDLL